MLDTIMVKHGRPKYNYTWLTQSFNFIVLLVLLLLILGFIYICHLIGFLLCFVSFVFIKVQMLL